MLSCWPLCVYWPVLCVCITVEYKVKTCHQAVPSWQAHDAYTQVCKEWSDESHSIFRQFYFSVALKLKAFPFSLHFLHKKRMSLILHCVVVQFVNLHYTVGKKFHSFILIHIFIRAILVGPSSYLPDRFGNGTVFFSSLSLNICIYGSFWTGSLDQYQISEHHLFLSCKFIKAN